MYTVSGEVFRYCLSCYTREVVGRYCCTSACGSGIAYSYGPNTVYFGARSLDEVLREIRGRPQ